jgi:hypothetical protein
VAGYTHPVPPWAPSAAPPATGLAYGAPVSANWPRSVVGPSFVLVSLTTEPCASAYTGQSFWSAGAGPCPLTIEV